MYWMDVIALLVILVLSFTKSIENDVQPCLSQSLEQVFLDHHEEKFDCSALPSSIQVTLALHFTFCHLNSTGINPNTICSFALIENNRSECLKNITQNPFAYLTYTNFIPHIQSICYAIETQRWHNHARENVQQLNAHSNQVKTEAKRLLVEQEVMQVSLDQALIVNQHSVDDALNVDRFLQVAQSDVEELRGHLYVKDRAQIELIQQILETLFNIQTSLFADAFGLSSYLFYAVTLIGIHMLTIPERTSDSKFWLILLWIGLVSIERYMLFFSSYSQIALYDALWRFRQLWFFFSCLLLAYYAVRYKNYYRENQKLIDEIDRKHKQLEIAARKCLKVINQLDRMNDSISDDPTNCSSENDDVSMSDTPTDEEEK